MSCNELREQLVDVVCGTEPSADVSKHVESCAACATTLSELRKTMALLDQWQAPEPSPYFDVRLQARLREEAAKQHHRWLAWMVRPMVAVSMAVVLVAGVSAFWIEQYEQAKPVPVVVGSAVSDLQVLENNHDMLSDSDPDSAASLLD